ncbi:MAG: putative tricarboxylic transport rane protein [Thermosediminibacterales bacterium]|nr:putative tricarboxylic transport rane protein [Thermosediminibacterales bacterium]MDK2835714.1 putative tricarboxylic transport rane protein [Thermosediminibacterales bacterium]
MDVFTIIFEKILNLHTLLALLMGVVGGMIIGGLPGLSATMGVALLIPLTFGMDPVAGLVMLTAIYTAAVYGGSISAILVHTPGTPASAATALDGYKLTLKGEGMKALGVSTVSSVIGGFFSGLALLVLAPPLSLISLKFNAPEYFLIAIFGLTIIGSLVTESLIKGLAAGVLGLIAGLVGVDILTGYPRYTFGLSVLESGISLIPAMIGLFSLSQALMQAEELGSTNKKQVINELKGRVLPKWKEFKSIIPTIIRSSIIGIFVGILPGAGGDVASWVSLNEAKRFSKKPEKFGTGCIEGIAAPEAANNAVTGGALIPLLTLGIPGSSTTAVLLGGLIIQGLIPGRELFTTYANITYSVIIGFILANILMGVCGLLGARYFAKVTKVSKAILTPIIIVLCVVGSYAIRNNIVDVYLMVVFGVIGYFMRKTGFHPAPVVLALILGPIAENGFRQSIILSRGNMLSYFFSRPICIILMILIVLAVLSPIYMNKFKKANMQQD